MTGNSQVQALFSSEYLILIEDEYVLRQDAPEWAKRAFTDIQDAFQKVYGGDNGLENSQ